MSEPKPVYKVKPLPRVCANCASYAPLSDRPNGHCRKHAPCPYVVPHGLSDFDKALVAYWPMVAEADWCDEWAERK
jgi:hypothetical protein